MLTGIGRLILRAKNPWLETCFFFFFRNGLNILLPGFFTVHEMLCPSSPAFFIITCLCSCLLGPPASQGAPLLECRCCHCHTCTTHRPSFLPLHSVSPGIQVLLFPFFSPQSPYICLQTNFPFLSLLYYFWGDSALHFDYLLLWFLIFFWSHYPPHPFTFPISHLHPTYKSWSEVSVGFVGRVIWLSL